MKPSNLFKCFFSTFLCFFFFLLVQLPDGNSQLPGKLFSKVNLSAREKASKEYHVANHAYEKGNTAKAIRHLKKAIDLMPTDEKYINALANIYHEQKEYKKALRYLTKLRFFIQDSIPERAIQMLNWEGCYALANGLRKEAILRFEEGLQRMKTYEISDSILASNLNCNWGVAELFDQGYSFPCDTALVGQCYKIHITDIQRAAKRFQKAIDFHPRGCNRQAIWNLALTDEILEISRDSLHKFKGYIPISAMPSLPSMQLKFSWSDECQKELEEEKRNQKIKEFDKVFENLPEYEEVLFVLDISGSMNAPARSDLELTRFELMKKLIVKEINKADSTQKIGMLTVGGDCSQYPSIAIPVDTNNRNTLLGQLGSLSPYGGTPLYSTLEKSRAHFSAETDKKRLILLASDGLEACRYGVSVCDLVANLCNNGIKLEVFSLLLDQKSNYNEFGLYQCLSDACQLPIIATTEKGVSTVQNTIAIKFHSLTLNISDLISGQFNPEPEVETVVVAAVH